MLIYIQNLIVETTLPGNKKDHLSLSCTPKLNISETHSQPIATQTILTAYKFLLQALHCPHLPLHALLLHQTGISVLVPTSACFPHSATPQRNLQNSRLQQQLAKRQESLLLPNSFWLAW